MLYHVLGTFFTFWLFWLFLLGGFPKIFEPGYMLCIFFFFFLKPSDRISLPFLAQIRFLCGGGYRAGRGEWDG